jgi:hypothetical protein
MTSLLATSGPPHPFIQLAVHTLSIVVELNTLYYLSSCTLLLKLHQERPRASNLCEGIVHSSCEHHRLASGSLATYGGADRVVWHLRVVTLRHLISRMHRPPQNGPLSAEPPKRSPLARWGRQKENRSRKGGQRRRSVMPGMAWTWEIP